MVGKTWFRICLALCSGVLLPAGWLPGAVSGAVAPDVAVRQFVHTVLSASAACQASYASMAGVVQSAVTNSGDPGTLMGFDDYLNKARHDCKRALSAVDAIQIPAALRAYAPVAVFDHSARAAVQTAVDSVASLTRITNSPPPSPSPDNDSALASSLESQIGFDDVAGAYANVRALAPRVVRYVTSPSSPAVSGGWHFQTLPLTATVGSIACPTATTCYAAGAAGMIVATTNGGVSWHSQANPAGRTTDLVAVACPTATTCYAAGYHGAILTTHDGGATWQRLATTIAATLTTMACPTATTCYALTATPTIVVTRDGGASWRVSNPLIGTGLHRFNEAKYTGLDLAAMACPSATTCYAVGTNWNNAGNPAVILATRDGGATWQTQRNPLGGAGLLFDIACPSATTCYAVGSDDTGAGRGAILDTTDGGTTWHSEASGTAHYLSSVACASATTCYAMGEKGTIVATTNGGATWHPENNFLAGTTSILGPVACPAAAICYAGADTLDGFLLVTSTGGR